MKKFKLCRNNQISEKSMARLFLAMPFILMDMFIRLLSFNVYYIMPTMIIPSLLFSTVWICLMVTITSLVGKAFGRIFYGICFVAFFLITFIQTSCYCTTERFFSFSMTDYCFGLTEIPPIIFALSVFLIGFVIYILINFQKYYYRTDAKKLFSITLIMVISQLLTPFLYGFANNTASWDTWRNPKNIYQNFNDYNKCIKVCGIYQYTFRDLYKCVFPESVDKAPEEIAFLDEIHKTPVIHQSNSKTGIFKGKNVVFLQLEGIDSWLLNPKDMPITSLLLNNSINFSNHYSFNIDGGSTFNSEFAVTTGYISPVTFEKSAYEFFNNYFPYSLPRMLKEHGYSANAFHMNSGEYYCRDLNYENFGYDNYFSLMDDEKQFDVTAKLDRELISNEFFYEKMFCGEKPFMNYIITYTPHKPFTAESDVGEILIKFDSSSYTEEDVARVFARETDFMVGLLMQALIDNDLYEDTVIVAFSDHYLYTIEDKTILEKHKNTDNNLINHTPFFIWSSDIEPAEVSKVNSQIDILPTVLNLFGISYNENNYIGNDIFDENFIGYVFFDDYDWYDGNMYFENRDVLVKKTSTQLNDESYESAMNNLVVGKIIQNDYTLKNDYFR